MSHIQSQAVFRQKLRDFGVESLQSRLINKGWDTIAAFAAAVTFNPEHSTEELFTTKVVQPVLAWNGQGDEPRYANNLRQLFWDCIQAKLADTRAKYDVRSEGAPVKMHKWDRTQRRKDVRESMIDAVPDIMTDDLDPAFHPEDILLARFEDNELGPYMGPDEFPTRHQEATFRHKNKKGHAEAAGATLWRMLTGQAVEENVISADASEIHLLEYAMKRRGIVFQTSGLMSFKKCETWRRYLFRAMRQEVVYAGESPPGVADILKADSRIWLMLNDATLETGVQPVNGLRPLEQALDHILDSAQINHMLVCRVRSGTRSASDGTSAAPKKPPKDSGTSADDKSARVKQQMQTEIKDLKNKLATAKAKAKPQQVDGGGRGRGKGGGKGNGRGRGRKGGGGGDAAAATTTRKRNFMPLPKPLWGLDALDENGEPYCFDAALGKCNKAKWGEKCPKGWHKCMAPNCKQLHSYVGNH